MMTEAQKEARVARAKRHVAADMLIAGAYIENGRGCSVGCDAREIKGRDPDDDYHAIVAAHDGTPEWLEHLRDAIFEGLPADKRGWWHVALAKAIPANVDLQRHYHLICASMLDMALESSATWDDEYRRQCVAAITSVRDLHLKAEPKERVASRAASSAAESAARSAAWAASSSARSAAESAAWAASSAAKSVASSAAAWAASNAASRAASSAANRAANSAAENAARSASSSAYVKCAELVIRALSSEQDVR
tara:strand:+ start:70 stop:825 length:756 start_codon:yes stop_codon:yes gene_type:complete